MVEASPTASPSFHNWTELSVGTGRSEAKRLDCPEWRWTIARRDGPEGIHVVCPSRRRSPERACFAEAVVPLFVADDELIEKPDVASLCCVAKPQREPRVIGTRGRIAARMVVITISDAVPGVRQSGTNT